LNRSFDLVVNRERKSKFVRLFDKTPPGVCCPHFYELILSNGCPYDCSYCYLRLTFRGNTQPTLFANGWPDIRTEIDSIPQGVFSTGELADSLAVIPPTLPQCLDYFSDLQSKFLLLVTKSINVNILRQRKPSQQIILSFSVNSLAAAEIHEKAAPSPIKRLEAASEMIDRGWRVRIRLDPIILETGIENYESICRHIANIHPEMVTVGTLRQYPALFRFAPDAPRKGLSRARDGRMRYTLGERLRTYEKVAFWLGFQPALCKETEEVWQALGWKSNGCNCTK
jgi:spore photoproduct lyase